MIRKTYIKVLTFPLVDCKGRGGGGKDKNHAGRMNIEERKSRAHHAILLLPHLISFAYEV
jgi:hypothetical protein